MCDRGPSPTCTGFLVSQSHESCPVSFACSAQSAVKALSGYGSDSPGHLHFPCQLLLRAPPDLRLLQPLFQLSFTAFLPLQDGRSPHGPAGQSQGLEQGVLWSSLTVPLSSCVALGSLMISGYGTFFGQVGSVFLWYQGSNSGPHICQVGPVPLSFIPSPPLWPS